MQTINFELIRSLSFGSGSGYIKSEYVKGDLKWNEFLHLFGRNLKDYQPKLMLFGYSKRSSGQCIHIPFDNRYSNIVNTYYISDHWKTINIGRVPNSKLKYFLAQFSENIEKLWVYVFSPGAYDGVILKHEINNVIVSTNIDYCPPVNAIINVYSGNKLRLCLTAS